MLHALHDSMTQPVNNRLLYSQKITSNESISYLVEMEHHQLRKCLITPVLDMLLSSRVAFVAPLWSHSYDHIPHAGATVGHRLLHAPFSMLEFGSSCFRTFLASDGLRQPKDHGIFRPLSHAVNWARYRYRLVKEPLEYQPLWTNLRWLMVWNANPGSSTNSTSQPRSHSITSYFSYANLSELGDKNSISASYEVHKLKTRCQDVKHGLINSSRLN